MSRSNQLIPIFCALVIPALPGERAPVRSAERPGNEQRAQLPSGETFAGRLVGSNADELSFVSRDGARVVPARETRQITFRHPPRRASGGRPVRRLELHGGERVHGELHSVDAERARVSIWGESERELPRRALAGVYQRAGARTIAYDGFEGEPTLFPDAPRSDALSRSGRQCLKLSATDGPCRHRLAEPLAAGCVELAYYDDGQVTPGAVCALRFEFQNGGGGAQIEIQPGWNGSDSRCAATGDMGLATQPQRRSAGWHAFGLYFDAQRVMALVDGVVVGSAARGPGGLREIVFVVTGNDAERAAWIDELHVARLVAHELPPANVQRRDCAWLAAGDELYGDVTAITPSEIRLEGSTSAGVLPWPELRGVIFGRSPGAAGRPVAGLIAEVELTPLIDAGVVPPDFLVGAIVSANESTLALEHPQLGHCAVPLTEVARVTPLFSGRMILIDGARRHLGDEIREDFEATLAEGPSLDWSFRLESLPAGRPFVSLLAADLEPGSPQAPQGRFRQELDAGFLRTELTVNGRRIDFLNRHVTWPAPSGSPIRVRIPLPAGLLKRGQNALRISQRPSRDDPQQFDDCELSRLTIEWEQ